MTDKPISRSMKRRINIQQGKDMQDGVDDMMPNEPTKLMRAYKEMESFPELLEIRMRHMPLRDTTAFEDGARWAKENIYGNFATLAFVELAKKDERIKELEDEEREDITLIKQYVGDAQKRNTEYRKRIAKLEDIIKRAKHRLDSNHFRMSTIDEYTRAVMATAKTLSEADQTDKTEEHND